MNANSGGAHFDVTVKVMRSFPALLRRIGGSALLCSAMAATIWAQDGAVPAPNGGHALSPQSAAPQPAAPQYADMLYASDAGIMEAYTGSCYDGCATCGEVGCVTCGPPRFWASVDALLWFQKGQYSQPLVSTSPPGTSQGLAGVLGADTTVLVGDEILPYDSSFGGRFTIGHWLDDSLEHAVLARYWVIGNSTFDDAYSSNGSTILAFPFYNVDLATEDARLVGFPNGQQGVLSGYINVHSVSSFNGGDVLLRTPIFRDCMRRWDLVAGYQFSRQEETLELTSTTNIQTQPNGPIDASVTMFDQFATSNEFHGGVLGLSIQRQLACYSLDILAKVAFGDMRQTTVIDGGTMTSTGSGAQIDPYGLYAQPTNIGTMVDNKFCVVPEVNINLGCQVCPCLKWYVGYTFIYWSTAARPGDQIDRLINTTYQGPLPVGDRRPDHSRIWSHNTWLHGLNLGLEYRF